MWRGIYVCICHIFSPPLFMHCVFCFVLIYYAQLLFCRISQHFSLMNNHLTLNFFTKFGGTDCIKHWVNSVAKLACILCTEGPCLMWLVCLENFALSKYLCSAIFLIIISLLRISLHTAILGLIPSLLQKNALAKYFWNVLKNCSNEIRFPVLWIQLIEGYGHF